MKMTNIQKIREQKIPDWKFDVAEDIIKDVIKNPKSYPDKMVVLTLDENEISKIMTPKRLEIIKTLKEREFESITDLADHLKRDRRAVVRDLNILESYKIVDYKKRGRVKIPYLVKDLVLFMVGKFTAITDVRSEVRFEGFSEEIQEMRETIDKLLGSLEEFEQSSKEIKKGRKELQKMEKRLESMVRAVK